MEQGLKRCRYIYYIQRQKARSKDIRHIINESGRLLYLK